MTDFNIIEATDSYKLGHAKQYPPDTTNVASYFESRVGSTYPETTFFGLQYLLRKISGRAVTQEKIDTVAGMAAAHLGTNAIFNREGWEYIERRHYGKLPVVIRAVPEGMTVPESNVLMTIEATDPVCYWLVNYLETLLVQAWYPSTVCTTSREVKKICKWYLEKTGGAPEHLDFMLHDFGFRGVSSVESAGIGGLAHLVNFKGTDTLAALRCGIENYDSGICGYSVPASEHSTMTSWGREYEVEAYLNMLKTYPTGIVSIVADSYDIEAACHMFGTILKDDVLAREGKTVIRPDCYDEKTEILTEHGWIPFPELPRDASVVQVEDDGRATLARPSKYVCQDYQGEMVRFHDEKGRLDLLVTPNHRMVQCDLEGKLLVAEAVDSKWRWERNLPRTCPTAVDGSKITAFEKFLIAFQADGSFPSNAKRTKDLGAISGHVRTRFNFQKKRKIDRLKFLAEEAGLVCEVKQEPARGKLLDQVTIYVNIPVNQVLSKTFDWVSPTTRSQIWCQEFIDELSHWDGTRRSDSRIKFDTTIEANADVAQQVAMLAGYGCTYGIREDVRSQKFSNVHTLTITTKDVVGGQSVVKTTENFSGKVYCVQVPSGRIVVRRNKRAVVCGNSGHPPEIVLKCLEILGEHFGTTYNGAHCKKLHPKIGVIQGDGCDLAMITEVLSYISAKGWSADNVVFGMGGGLLQKLDRDTQRFAFKCSAVERGGEWFDVWKDPKSDRSKASKRGRLKLIRDPAEGLKTVRLEEPGENLLKKVFENGEMTSLTTLDDVRMRAAL